jgi:hypothetical protein
LKYRDDSIALVGYLWRADNAHAGACRYRHVLNQLVATRREIGPAEQDSLVGVRDHIEPEGGNFLFEGWWPSRSSGIARELAGLFTLEIRYRLVGCPSFFPEFNSFPQVLFSSAAILLQCSVDGGRRTGGQFLAGQTTI